MVIGATTKNRQVLTKFRPKDLEVWTKLGWKAIENGHRNSEFSHKKKVIFNSYVKLPEGTRFCQLRLCNKLPPM
jgi:hypothetical protein